jgi:hypothetical protein
MADEENKSISDEASSSEDVLDLSVLQGLDLGPDWGNESSAKKLSRPSSRKSDFNDRRRTNGRQGGAGKPRLRRNIAKPTKPVEPRHLISFVPEEALFTNLVRELRTSCRTYPLFDLAKLILEKPERFAVLAKPVEKPNEDPPSYFVTKPNGLPFIAREEAFQYLMTNQGEAFFEVEERDAEAPKGSFSVVSKCGVTGELLPPPNYHRYAELIHEHHATRLSDMPFEKFQRGIQTEQDPEAVANWLESMKRVRVYRLKNSAAEGEPEFFDTRESLQRFLFEQRFPKQVKRVGKVRLSGVHVEQLPTGELKRDIEQALEEQRRFPLLTANLLRSRFRRMNFAVSKHGAKGITFVCAAKRRFRTATTVFADSIQSLLRYLDENPKARKSDLIEGFLGFASGERSKEQDASVRQLARDCRWLVAEGYLAEFTDGALLLPPLSTTSKSKPEKNKRRKKKNSRSSESETADIISEDEPESASSDGSENKETSPSES